MTARLCRLVLVSVLERSPHGVRCHPSPIKEVTPVCTSEKTLSRGNRCNGMWLNGQELRYATSFIQNKYKNSHPTAVPYTGLRAALHKLHVNSWQAPPPQCSAYPLSHWLPPQRSPWPPPQQPRFHPACRPRPAASKEPSAGKVPSELKRS